MRVPSEQRVVVFTHRVPTPPTTTTTTHHHPPPYHHHRRPPPPTVTNSERANERNLTALSQLAHRGAYRREPAQLQRPPSPRGRCRRKGGNRTCPGVGEAQRYMHRSVMDEHAYNLRAGLSHRGAVVTGSRGDKQRIQLSSWPWGVPRGRSTVAGLDTVDSLMWTDLRPIHLSLSI